MFLHLLFLWTKKKNKKTKAFESLYFFHSVRLFCFWKNKEIETVFFSSRCSTNNILVIVHILENRLSLNPNYVFWIISVIYLFKTRIARRRDTYRYNNNMCVKRVWFGSLFWKWNIKIGSHFQFSLDLKNNLALKIACAFGFGFESRRLFVAVCTIR